MGIWRRISGWFFALELGVSLGGNSGSVCVFSWVVLGGFLVLFSLSFPLCVSECEAWEVLVLGVFFCVFGLGSRAVGRSMVVAGARWWSGKSLGVSQV